MSRPSFDDVDGSAPASPEWLFSGCRLPLVPRIADRIRRRRYAPGDVLVTEGDPGHSVFLIARGSVRVLVRGGHGQPFDERRLDAGESFGEVAVLSGWPRTATVVAATPCDILEVDREALERERSRSRRVIMLTLPNKGLDARSPGSDTAVPPGRSSLLVVPPSPSSRVEAQADSWGS